jgi:hypothetical protein
MSFTIRFDDNNQEIVFGGVMRPKAAGELAILHETINEAQRRISGTLFLNFKRLNKLNNIATLHSMSWQRFSGRFAKLTRS